MSKKNINMACAGKGHDGDVVQLVYKKEWDKLKSDRDILRKALVGVCTTDDVELLTAMVKKTNKRFRYAKEMVSALKALLEVRP